MKVTVSGLREKYGDCYITELPDGHLVPWKGLTLKEYIKYKEDFDRELIAVPVLENEIFVKSVLDSFIVKNIDKQKAGTVSTVVSKIMEEAGPSNLFEFNYHLMAARQAITENVFHHIIY